MTAISPKTKVYGLIGFPLSHSFSIDFFNNKFCSECINARYLNFEIEDINQLLELIAEYPQLDGLNVTAPYKEAVIPFLNELDETAQLVGAVNVIKFVRNPKTGEHLLLRGYNSDVFAFKQTMLPLLSPDLKALILGTGGAAKAVKCALEQLNIPIQMVSRHKSAKTLVYPEITKAMVNKYKLIVNATPLGKFPHVDECPDFPYRFMGSDHVAYDLIYNPEETRFMREAKAQGAQVKNGLEMLLLQAFASYEIWTQPIND